MVWKTKKNITKEGFVLKAFPPAEYMSNSNKSMKKLDVLNCEITQESAPSTKPQITEDGKQHKGITRPSKTGT